MKRLLAGLKHEDPSAEPGSKKAGRKKNAAKEGPEAPEHNAGKKAGFYG